MGKTTGMGRVLQEMVDRDNLFSASLFTSKEIWSDSLIIYAFRDSCIFLEWVKLDISNFIHKWTRSFSCQ